MAGNFRLSGKQIKPPPDGVGDLFVRPLLGSTGNFLIAIFSEGRLWGYLVVTQSEALPIIDYNVRQKYI